MDTSHKLNHLLFTHGDIQASPQHDTQAARFPQTFGRLRIKR